MLIEEACDLILAVMKYKRNRGNHANIAEELGDVILVGLHVINANDIEKNNRRFVGKKNERLESRHPAKGTSLETEIANLFLLSYWMAFQVIYGE